MVFNQIGNVRIT